MRVLMVILTAMTLPLVTGRLWGKGRSTRCGLFPVCRQHL